MGRLLAAAAQQTLSRVREAERNAPFLESVKNWCVSLALHTPYMNHSINTLPAVGCAFARHRRLTKPQI